LTASLPHSRSRSTDAGRCGALLVGAVVAVWAAGVLLGFREAVTALTFLGFVVGTLGLLSPALGVYGVALLVTLDPISRHLVFNSGGLLRWNTFNYWLAILMLLWAPHVVRRADPHSRLLAALILVMALGLLLSPDISTGLQNVLNVATALGLVLWIERSGAAPTTMYWVALVMAVTAAVGGLEYFRQMDAGATMNKNVFALFPLAGVLGASVGAQRVSAGRQMLLALLASINTAWVFLSGSRGNLLVALLALALLLSAMTFRRLALTAAIAALVGMVSVAGFGTLQQHAAARLTLLTNVSRSLEERTSGRTNLAQGGWRLFTRNPLGVGTGGFESRWATLDHDDAAQFSRGKQVPAHSAWVMVLAENGVPGIGLLGAYLVSFAMVGLRSGSPTQTRLGVSTTLILGVAFLNNEFQSKALWLMAAATAVLLHAEPRAMFPLRRRRPLAAPEPADV
jgi:hypothetical protein